MNRYDIKVQIPSAGDLHGPLEIAAMVCLPAELKTNHLIVGLPGGGYGREYYDIHRSGGKNYPGYSQAQYHTDRGAVFVGLDHIGVGESWQPENPFALSYENIAEGNHRAVTAIVDGLRNGTLIDGESALNIGYVVGIGQSMGGMLLTVQQARHKTFDGIAVLGSSAIHTNFPNRNGGRILFDVPPRGADLMHHLDLMVAVGTEIASEFDYCFHWEDQDPELVRADLAAYDPNSGAVRGDELIPWGSPTTPACAITMVGPGAAAEDAAAITVPVLVVSGERDVIGEPLQEVAAYSSSSDVSVLVVPRMAHMHNFARTREVVWHRIHSFVTGTAERAKLY